MFNLMSQVSIKISDLLGVSATYSQVEGRFLKNTIITEGPGALIWIKLSDQYTWNSMTDMNKGIMD